MIYSSSTPTATVLPSVAPMTLNVTVNSSPPVAVPLSEDEANAIFSVPALETLDATMNELLKIAGFSVKYACPSSSSLTMTGSSTVGS